MLPLCRNHLEILQLNDSGGIRHLTKQVVTSRSLWPSPGRLLQEVLEAVFSVTDCSTGHLPIHLPLCNAAVKQQGFLGFFILTAACRVDLMSMQKLNNTVKENADAPASSSNQRNASSLNIRSFMKIFVFLWFETN